MLISDWSSDVCSSDLMNANEVIATLASRESSIAVHPNDHVNMGQSSNDVVPSAIHVAATLAIERQLLPALKHLRARIRKRAKGLNAVVKRSEEHTSELQSLMRNSYAVFCLKKKKT